MDGTKYSRVTSKKLFLNRITEYGYNSIEQFEKLNGIKWTHVKWIENYRGWKSAQAVSEERLMGWGFKNANISNVLETRFEGRVDGKETFQLIKGGRAKVNKKGDIAYRSSFWGGWDTTSI